MLKVNNKEVLSELAMSTYKANKKRNLLTITAIFLTTFLISTVLSLGLSYWNTISLRQERMNGINYDIELTEPREDQVPLIRQMDSVEYAGLAVKCALVSQYQDITLDKLRLFWLDDICWQKQTIPALEKYTGTYPEKENEIMLSQTALSAMGITSPQIGMSLPCTYVSLAETSDGLDKVKAFTLSGWFLDYTGSTKGYISEFFYKTTGVCQTDLTQGSLKISLKNPLYSEKDITNMQLEIGISGNQIIEADYDTISNFCKMAAGLIAMLVLVFFSGYLFIYNTLYLSITKDIRYYGQLKTLGTTSRQLKSLIYKQVLWNSLIGIPFGLIASGFIAKIIIPQTLHIVNPTISAKEVIPVSAWVFAVAAVFAFITTFISSRKPIKMAENYSPIEAINYIGAIKAVKINKTRKPFFNGGNLSSMVKQNLLRDKKQFVVILISLGLAVSLFLVVNVVITGNNAKSILNTIYDYDLRILNQTLLDDHKQQAITDDLIKRIRNTAGVADVRIVKSTSAVVPYQEDVYGEYYKEVYQSRYSPGNYELDMQSYKENPAINLFNCRIVGIDDSQFDQLNQGLEHPVDSNKFKQGSAAFVSASIINMNEDILGKTVRFSLPDGLESGKEETIQIQAIAKDNPAYYAGGYTPDLIISNSYLEKLLGNTFTELINIDYTHPFSGKAEKAILQLIDGDSSLSADSKLERYSEMKNSENQVKVLGNSVGIIVMLLAVLNYVNMMASSIQTRSKEFAILESIGMTTKQIKKMIILEGGSYACISLGISVLLGFPLSYAVFHNFNIYNVPFEVPAVRNLTLFLVIIVTCVTTPIWIFNNSYKESIIEQLRNDEC